MAIPLFNGDSINNNQMKYILQTMIFSLLVFSSSLKAQKKPFYNEEEKVIEAAYLHLEKSVQDGAIKAWAEGNKPKGSYTMDITIRNKGEVATIRVVERKGGDIPTQNALKNYLKAYRFPFKMPKERSFQFQYEFKF